MNSIMRENRAGIALKQDHVGTLCSLKRLGKLLLITPDKRKINSLGQYLHSRFQTENDLVLVSFYFQLDKT